MESHTTNMIPFLQVKAYDSIKQKIKKVFGYKRHCLHDMWTFIIITYQATPPFIVLSSIIHKIIIAYSRFTSYTFQSLLTTQIVQK